MVVEVSYDDVTPQSFVTLTFAYDPNNDYRGIDQVRSINNLVNAKVIGIRQDLDSRRYSHISYKQEELLTPGRRPTRNDFDLAPLPNPSSNLPQFVRKNPGSFFGVPDKLEIYLGGYPVEQVDTLPSGEKVVREYRRGGRRVQLPLLRPATGRYLGEKIPGELEKSYERWYKGEPGYKTFVDPRSLVTGETPNYRRSSLGFEYNTAVDDRYGMGQEGNSVTSMNKQISKSENYLETMEGAHFSRNKQQALEDSKVYRATFSSIPGGNTEIETRGYYDEGYVTAYKGADAKLRKALTPTKLADQLDPMVDSVLSNPRPIKDDIWQMRVDVYIEEFNKWDSLPEPKEEWENYAVGMFLPWELPILEKDRQMRTAQTNFELTPEEASQVDMQYASSQSEDLFDLILSDLYEVPDDDEETPEAIV